MKQIEYKGKTYDIPEELEELTPKQYYRYLEVATMTGRMLKEPEVRLKLVELFLELPTAVMYMPREEWRSLMKHMPLADPFIIREQRGIRLALKTGVNLLPQWDGFFGPEDWLNDVTYGTFCDVMAHISEKHKPGADEDDELRQIGALLYKRIDGKKRRPPQLLCLHAYLFFSNVMEIIKEEPMNINGSLLDLRLIFRPTEDKRADDHTGWTGIGMDIAEGGTFGTYREVRGTPLWDILIFLYKKKFDKIHNQKKRRPKK